MARHELPKVTASELGVEIGSIFSRSWGYDQTNVNFYQVVGISPSGLSVHLREISKTIDPMLSGVVPLKDCWYDEQEHYTKRLQSIMGTPCTAFNTYSHLSLWDGKPEYETAAVGGAGH